MARREGRRGLLDVVARTFGAGRIAVWMRFEADDRFHQVRSINVEASPKAIKCDMPVEVVFTKVSDDVTLPLFQPRR